MSNICSHCGAFIADDATICPHCGTPTAHAPHPDDKKFWDEKPNTALTPPPLNDVPYQPQRHCQIEPLKKREMNKAVLIAAVVLMIAVALIAYYTVQNATPQSPNKTARQTSALTPSDSDTHIVVQEINGAEADSIMRSHMAEMEKMMEEMMEGDHFEEFENMPEEMATDGSSSTPPPTITEQKRKASAPGKIRLVGNVGTDHYVMVLNVKDQNNITGTAAIVAGGKERTTYRLLGIGSGKDLTVSVYSTKNKIVGTLNGTYDGYCFTGVYTTDNGETQFQLMAQ